MSLSFLSPGNSQQGPRNTTHWILIALLVAAVLLTLFFVEPYVTAVYELYWSGAGVQSLLYDDLGFSSSWSQFIGVVAGFIYALAWVPLSLWTYRLFSWKFSARQLGIAFASWVFVYGHAPLLHALFGTDACFNQRTGVAMKWYIRSPNGQITLSDSGGFDVITGEKKKLITPVICANFSKQRTQSIPHKITTDLKSIDFFDPVDGRPRVWYSKSSDGNFQFFDAPGFDPETSEPLLPVTKDIVAQSLANARKQDDAHAADAARAAKAAVEVQRPLEDPDPRLEQEKARAAAAARAQQQQLQAQEAAAAKAAQDQAIEQQKKDLQRQLQQQRAAQQAAAQLADQRARFRAQWRSTHNGCDVGTHSQYFDCQHTNAPECMHIGGNGGYLCVPD